MQHDRTSPLPYLLAFIGLAACITYGVTERRSEKPAAAPAQAKKGLVVPKPPTAGETKGPAEAEAPVQGRVVLITVDGWHVRLTDRMPVWKELSAEGAWSLAAQVPKGATTVISHAALYTGADPAVNGVEHELENVRGDEHVHGTKFRWKPLKVTDTLVSAVETAGYRTVAVVQKGKLVGLLRQSGDGTDISVRGDAGLIKTVCEAVKSDANRLVIAHIGSPDGAGHDHGWLSDEQYATAVKVSAQMQTIRKCIADAASAGGIPTTLVVTSDHGGTTVDACMAKRNKARCGHGANDDSNRLVPLAIVGPGIKAGHQISGKPRLVDVSATVLRILGLPPSSISTLSGVSIDEAFDRP